MEDFRRGKRLAEKLAARCGPVKSVGAAKFGCEPAFEQWGIKRANKSGCLLEGGGNQF
jgi:hypothetical protein